eukprot:gene998-10773_t
MFIPMSSANSSEFLEDPRELRGLVEKSPIIRFLVSVWYQFNLVRNYTMHYVEMRKGTLTVSAKTCLHMPVTNINFQIGG